MKIKNINTNANRYVSIHQNNSGAYTDDKNIPYMYMDLTEIILRIASGEFSISEIFYKDGWTLIETTFKYL